MASCVLQAGGGWGRTLGGIAHLCKADLVLRWPWTRARKRGRFSSGADVGTGAPGRRNRISSVLACSHAARASMRQDRGGPGWVALQRWAVAGTGRISAGLEVCGPWEPREFPAVDSSLRGPLSPSQDPRAHVGQGLAVLGEATQLVPGVPESTPLSWKGQPLTPEAGVCPHPLSWNMHGRDHLHTVLPKSRHTR